jgi:hypothetical protein
MTARDAIAVSGAALILWGTWAVFPPASLIVAGVLLLGVSVVLVPAERPRRRRDG